MTEPLRAFHEPDETRNSRQINVWYIRLPPEQPQVGLSIIIRFLFGGALATSVFIAGIVTMIYTGAGGLLSVAYTGES